MNLDPTPPPVGSPRLRRAAEGSYAFRVGAGSAPPPTQVRWTVVVTEPLPNCPSVEAAWSRIATQKSWERWRPPSRMRGRKVSTVVVPPATEPLTTGDEYIVEVNRVLRVHCRVLESPADAASRDDSRMVFDAAGVALGGLVRSRFRFTVFQDEERTVMACAQERITATLPFLVPSKETLEREHRHTLTVLNQSFLRRSA